MIRQLLFGSIAAVSMMAASAASAADWWLLSRPPVGQVVLFADAATVERAPAGGVSLRVLRIDREGFARETVESLSCAGADRLSRFACALPDERDDHGLILAGMSPAEVARMLFDMPPVEAEGRGRGY